MLIASSKRSCYQSALGRGQLLAKTILRAFCVALLGASAAACGHGPALAAEAYLRVVEVGAGLCVVARTPSSACAPSSGKDDASAIAEVERGEDYLRDRIANAARDERLGAQTQNYLQTALSRVESMHDEVSQLRRTLPWPGLKTPPPPGRPTVRSSGDDCEWPSRRSPPGRMRLRSDLAPPAHHRPRTAWGYSSAAGYRPEARPSE
jgi:hypothetical protein